MVLEVPPAICGSLRAGTEKNGWLALIRVRNLWQKVKRLEGVKISSTLSSS
jgi:hypothetical protein